MIVRRIDEVEKLDVGKPLGLPEKMFQIQWIFSNEIGDERYHHSTRSASTPCNPGFHWRRSRFTITSTSSPPTF